MRFGGKHRSWQIGVGDAEPFLLGALWIRDVEHLTVPPDETMPGPVDAERLPPPSIEPADRADLQREWVAWWRSIIDHAERPPLLPPDPSLEPAYDTPDPLGLARLPRLGAVVTRRWPDYLEWRIEHYRDWRTRRTEPNPETGNVVRAVETELGRKLRPVELHFLSYRCGTTASFGSSPTATWCRSTSTAVPAGRPGCAPSSWRSAEQPVLVGYALGIRRIERELTQWRVFLSVMCSPRKTCPRWLSQLAQRISVRAMPRERSSISLTAPGMASSNEGQPQWLSNFVSLANNWAPHARHT